MKKTTLILIMIFWAELIFGTEVQVTGKVTNINNEGVPYAVMRFICDKSGEAGLASTDENGNYSVSLTLSGNEIDNSDPILTNFELYQNYPNPFNPGTWIPFQLSKPATAEVSIYNILGERICVIANQHFPSGISKVYWDGTNEKGKSVSAGVYIYQVKSERTVKSNKMLLLDGGNRNTYNSVNSQLSRQPVAFDNEVSAYNDTFIVMVEKDGYCKINSEQLICNSGESQVQKDLTLYTQYHICYNNADTLNSRHWQVYLNTIDGNAAKVISNNPYNDCYNPTWSPDGNSIIFRWDNSIGGSDIYKYDISNDTLINLTDDLLLGQSADLPKWSPDGEKIIFRNQIDLADYQYIMNKDGSSKRELNDWVTHFYNDSYHFICSRNDSIFKTDIDGNNVKYLMNLDSLTNYHIYIDDFDSENELILLHEDSASWTFYYSFLLKTYNIRTKVLDTLLIADPGWIIAYPYYSDDCSMISFKKVSRSEDDDYLNMVILKNKEMEEIMSIRDANTLFYYKSFLFSPNNKFMLYSKMVFLNDYHTIWNYYLYVINLNTLEEKMIDNEKAHDAEWNPQFVY